MIEGLLNTVIQLPGIIAAGLINPMDEYMQGIVLMALRKFSGTK